MSLVNSERERRPSRLGAIIEAHPQRGTYKIRPAADSKALAVRAARVSNKESVQPNIGRIQQKNALEYFNVIYAPIPYARIARPAGRPTERKVLERFQGFVEKVEGDWAHITLTTEKGEELAGTYPASELAAKGIHERDRFLLATVEQGESVLFDICLIPRRDVSPAEQRAIRETIARELGDYSSDDDY